MMTSFRQTYIDALKYYYYVGGMPEAVLSFSEEKDFNEVRSIQKRILDAYEQDFSKHAPVELVPKIRMLWNSIPSQLAKENKKFIYGLLREGARAKDYETAIMWLSDCGLIHKVSRVNTIGIPLKAYEDLKAFKLFVLDVGLLSCMTGLSQRTLLDGNQLFVEFKGALTEQYVCQQLQTNSPGFKESNVCKLHFLWIISSAKQHNSSANVMDKPFAELSKLFNVIFGIHFFPIPRVGRCLQNGLMIGTAL